jgi:hypothetical protein
MAIRYLNESSLSTSEVFKGINELSGDDQTQKAINLIKGNKFVTKDEIEGPYIQIKQYPNSLSRAALKAFEDEKIKLIYNDVKQVSVSKALPFITFKMSDGIRTFVFLDNYASRNRDNILTIQATILHDLLIGALISNSLKKNYDLLIESSFLQKLFMELYTKFVCRILNRQSQIAALKVEFDSVQYYTNKFFLLNVFGLHDTPENVDTTASKHFKNIDDIRADELRRNYDAANPTNVTGMLNLVKTVSTRLNSLSLGTFLTDWINYYYPPATLAIDTMEYLIFMVVSLLNGNNVINITATEIVKEQKNIKVLREELLKLI